MLLQERFQANGFALSFWLKVFCCVTTLPILLWIGFPTDIWFYIIISFQALFWAVSDVVYFNSLSSFGAGVVSRVLPFSIIFTFFFWLPFDAPLLEKYVQSPFYMGIVVCATLLILLGI